jgi:hypothetical protein
MARLIVGATFGLVVGTVFGAALGLHADTVDAEVVEAAAAAHVNPVDLAGAVNSTGTDPYDYLRGTGELPPLPTEAPPKAVSVQPPPNVWDRLAACESNGRWGVASGNGYYGALQIDMIAWRRYGGIAFAPTAALASPSQQILIAERILASQGPAAWPVCSRVVGLR